MINSCFIGTFGAVVDLDTVKKSGVAIESVRRVVAKLEPTEQQRLVDDLRFYNRTGERSDFLLGILAVAAGEFREGAKPVTVFNLQPNVVGVFFGDVRNAGRLRSA